MKLKLVLILCFCLQMSTFAQVPNLSSQSEISVLTIGPGASLNDSFGHSGYRVNDPINGIDVVFNYGVYDFNTPNFYTKFAQGKLNYKIGLNYFEDFFESYVSQNRWIKEQVLNLTPSEKQEIFDYLSTNLKPENRDYLYDFFYDNCATKIKDVVAIVLKDRLEFKEPEGFQPETFRTLIQNQLHKNSWGSLGIDIALGSVIDQKATAEEHMFLPEFIYAFFESATLNASEKLVKQPNLLFENRNTKKSNNFVTSPWMILGGISFLILLITFFDYKKNKRTVWLDAVLFALTGLIGVFILLLWFATDHTATANNYNLLWAFALNIFMVTQILKKTIKIWFIKYLKFLVILFCLLTFHWIVGVQIFAITLLPLFIALMVRYVYCIHYFKQQK